MNDLLKNDIYIPKNFVETAQELQFQVAIQDDSDIAIQMARDALELLNKKERQTIAGTKDVILHTMSAMIIEQIIDDAYNVTKIDDLILRGNIKSLSIFRFGQEIPTIFMNVGGATIKEPIYPEDPNKGRVNGVLRVPVSSVVSIWPAA